MKLRVPLIAISRLFFYCLAEVAGAAALIGLILWSLPYLTQSRDQLEKDIAELGAAPNVTTQQATLEASLLEHGHDIGRIQAYILPKDAVVNFITVLEQTATARGVQVRIPGLEVEEKKDDSGQVVPSSGPYEDVRVTIQATGTPEVLLQFVHDLEHLPYLLAVDEWQVTAASPVTLSPIGARAPAAPGQEEAEAQPSGQLDASLLLKVITP